MPKGLTHRPFEGLGAKKPEEKIVSKWSKPEKYEAYKAELTETKVIDGRVYRRIPSGYTIREFFSHHTSEKGPGPGWDTRVRQLIEIGLDPWDTASLPNDPYYQYELIEDQQEET